MMLYVALTFTPLTIRDFYSVITSVVLGGIVAAAYGATVFFQHPTQAQLDTGRLIIQVGENIIDPNHFANALLFPAAVLGMWSLRTPRTYAKLFGIGGVGLILAAILYSGSREALIGFGAIVLYYLWRSRYRLQVLVATLGALIASFSIQTTIWSRFSTAMLTGGSGRSSIWAVAWEAAKHRPLQGYGIGNFQQAYDMFYLAVQQPYPYGWSSPAHNIVFHYAVELGVVGLALIVWFYCRVFRSLRIVERDSPLYDYRIMLEGALVAIAAVSFSVDLFTYKYAWLVISAAALFCNAVAGQVQSEEIRSQSSAMMEARPLRS
jgi:O-antigen ligase